MFSQVAYGIIGERRIFSGGSYIAILNHVYMQWREEGCTHGRNLEEGENGLQRAELLMLCVSQSVWALHQNITRWAAYKQQKFITVQWGYQHSWSKGPFLSHRLIASSHSERDKEALWALFKNKGTNPINEAHSH